MSNLPKRLRGWATDAGLGRVMIGADQDIREAAQVIEQLKEALVRTAASLAAAISLLERGGKAAKRAAPSDKMFDQMLIDYNRALDAAREALKDTE